MSKVCSAARGQPVAVQRPGRLLPAQPGAVLVAAVQDLQQRPADQLGVGVGLGEEARPHPRAEHGRPGVRHRVDRDVGHRLVLDVRVGAAAGEQPQEVRLARPVGARARPPGRRSRPRGRTAASGR